MLFRSLLLPLSASRIKYSIPFHQNIVVLPCSCRQPSSVSFFPAFCLFSPVHCPVPDFFLLLVRPFASYPYLCGIIFYTQMFPEYVLGAAISYWHIWQKTIITPLQTPQASLPAPLSASRPSFSSSAGTPSSQGGSRPA